jgi:hypothetical protein
MGYFASLMRQTGISARGAVSRPASVVRGIEVDETRIAQLPPGEVVSHPYYSAPVAPHRDAPPLLSSDSRTALPKARARPAEAAPAPQEAAASPGPREIVVKIPSPPRTEIREYVLEQEKRAPEEVAAPNEVAPPPGPHTMTAAESQPASRIATVRVGKLETPQPSGERRLPTLAEVRAWVAQPLPQAAESQAPEPAPSRPLAVTRVDDAPPPAIDRSESYNLEIDTIQILIDGPAAAAPQRSAPATRRSEPAKPSWNRASRYYLRP